MTKDALLFAIIAGAGALAVWLYVRLAARRPKTFGRACAHGLVAAIVLACVPFAMDFMHSQRSDAGAFASLLGGFLPALTYMFLASLYVMEHLQRRIYAR